MKDMINEMFWNKAKMKTGKDGDEWIIKKKDWNDVAESIAKLFEQKEKSTVEVESVLLFFPASDIGEVIEHRINRKGVTEIKEVVISPAPYCSVKYYEIYRGKNLVAEMHHFSEVIYFEETQ